MLQLSNPARPTYAPTTGGAPDTFPKPIAVARTDRARDLARTWRTSLALVERHLSFTRRSLHSGDPVQTAGEPFQCLHLVHFGAVKSLVVATNGSQQVAGLFIKGDWAGFDGIATGVCACDAFAMDTTEIWTVRYQVLLKTTERVPELAHALYVAMSSQLARDREWRFALATLSADARLADFLRAWAQALALRELRTDHITLRLTRAEIGNYLGMTLETVSRSFSRLVAQGLISFDDKGRRHFAIPNLDALIAYVDGKVHPDVGILRRPTRMSA
jgi:CRP/FNR family transcriptional regulator